MTIFNTIINNMHIILQLHQASISNYLRAELVHDACMIIGSIIQSNDLPQPTPLNTRAKVSSLVLQFVKSINFDRIKKSYQIGHDEIPVTTKITERESTS